MDDSLLAYLAGVIDSDGYISIKRTTYHMRVRGDAGVPLFSEKIGCKQVTPEAIDLLHQTFGGSRRLEAPSTKNGRHLYSWTVTDKQAANAAAALLPHMRIKRRQCEILLRLRELKAMPREFTGETSTFTSRWGNQMTRRNKRVSPERIAMAEQMRDDIMALNKG